MSTASNLPNDMLRAPSSRTELRFRPNERFLIFIIGRVRTRARICLTFGLRRIADRYSPTQFRTHWSGPHADIIKRIIAHFPNAERVRYTQNRVVRILWQHSSSAQPFDVDGLVEIHLTTKTPPEAAVSSGAVANMLEDELRFIRAFTECHVEAEGSDLDDGRGQKIIFIAAKRKEVDERTFATG